MDKKEKLLALNVQVEKCKQCELYKKATNAVPGEGSPDAKVVFIGEAPGFHEDSQGRPFVGTAGKYLDHLLSKVGLKREEVFIANVVKHRPPENRDPELGEIAACSAWLEMQLSIINPKAVVTLGRWSLARYLPRAKISQVHGKAFKKQGMVVLPMYHPAAALRSAETARRLEADFLKNKELLVDPETFQEESRAFDDIGQGSLF